MKARFLMLGIYSVAMAFVEAAVVVYLRSIYSPGSLTALTRLPLLIYRVELFREAATILMIVAVGYLAFTRLRYRIIAFLWVFAIWDLLYYAFLRLTLGWPAGLGATDVLFLIPVPWISPVWLPVAVSTIVLCVASYLFVRERDQLS